jgi:hypothetical protein
VARARFDWPAKVAANCDGGGRGHAGGDGVVGKPQSARADPLGYLTRREASYGSTAMAVGGADGCGPVAATPGDGQGPGMGAERQGDGGGGGGARGGARGSLERWEQQRRPELSLAAAMAATAASVPACVRAAARKGASEWPADELWLSTSRKGGDCARGQGVGAWCGHERHVRTRVAHGGLLPNTWWMTV